MSYENTNSVRAFTFLAVIAVAFALFACKRGREAEVTRSEELQRVTSPSGQLDAVLVHVDGGGAAGGWEWYVYIVPQGQPVIMANAHPIFNAGTMTAGRLLWSREHLLEIHYDVAYINQFRNLWGLSEVQSVGSAGEHDYLIETRLSPSSPDFSLLTPQGAFRPKTP